MPVEVLHIINGLGLGGAETTLVNIIKNQQDRTLHHSVITLGGSYYYEQVLKDLGVTLFEFKIKRNPIRTLLNICKITKSYDLLCTWMYHSNFLGFFVSKLCRKPLLWNIRHASLSPEYNRHTTLFVNSVCAFLSRWVDVVAYNGDKSKLIHEKCGYLPRKNIVLVNGCDLDVFHFIPEARSAIVQELTISKESRIVLSLSRFSPIKDVPCFLKSFALIKQQFPSAVAVMCGDGLSRDNAVLVELLPEYKLQLGQDIFLLGKRQDVPELLSAADIFVLHSASEAFPNVLIQAMACETLCVSTDVGDAKEILGDCTNIVPPGDCVNLSKKACEMLVLEEIEAEKICKKNMELVHEKYDLSQVVHFYEDVIKSSVFRGFKFR